MGKKFGEGGKRTFGVGYFFLRFLCPALACPENVQGPVGGEMKKFCILLSKLIQMVCLHYPNIYYHYYYYRTYTIL